MASVSIKHRIEYLALRVVAAIVRSLPRKTALAFGRVAGRLSMTFLPGRYRLARENMTLALPELSAVEIEAKVRKNFEHIGASGVEMLRLDMLKRGKDDLNRYFDLENVHLLREALALNKGVILLTAHLGFWEAGNFIMSDLEIPCAAVAKPLKNPLSDRYFEEIRTSFGTEILNSRKGARRILKSLRRNRVVVVLLDQHISPPGSVMVDFFGREAYTTTAIANLAMKYQIPIVPIFFLRQADDRYKVWAEPIVTLTGEGESAVIENTQRLTNIIETAVLKDVSQWFWMHKRWRKKKVKDKGEGQRFKDKG
ncbi:MAG: lysophospholipid acyltransferase family protein [Thermodesulfobacteriota bacterium]|nr:lysophospholipid acyltransferase family protein [Thermodesulfobacteriota bacterium]